MHFDQLLERLIRRNATELRIQSGRPAEVYAGNQLVPITAQTLSDADVSSLIQVLTTPDELLEFGRTGDVHFQFEFGPRHPFNVHLLTRDNRPMLVIRREY